MAHGGRKRRKRKKEGETCGVEKTDVELLLKLSDPPKPTDQSPTLCLLLSQLTPRASSASPKDAMTS